MSDYEPRLGIYNLLQPVKLAGLLHAAVAANPNKQPDSVSAYLVKRLGKKRADLKSQLNSYISPKMPAIDQMQAMVDALNALLEDPDLYDRNVFTSLPRKLGDTAAAYEEAKNKQTPFSPDRLRQFNRDLLENAYYDAANNQQVIGSFPRRLHFFDGQFLRPADLQEEQDYHRHQLRIHNRALHTSGIAEGLEAEWTDRSQNSKKDSIDVSAGVAVDADGNELIFLGHSNFTSFKKGDAVYLVFKENLAAGDGVRNTRWQMTTELRAFDKSEITRMGVHICTISDGDKPEIAQKVGIRSETSEVSTLSFKSDSGSSDDYPRFQATGTTRADSVVTLHNGSLKIDDGNLEVSGSSAEFRLYDQKVKGRFARFTFADGVLTIGTSIADAKSFRISYTDSSFDLT